VAADSCPSLHQYSQRRVRRYPRRLWRVRPQASGSFFFSVIEHRGNPLTTYGVADSSSTEFQDQLCGRGPCWMTSLGESTMEEQGTWSSYHYGPAECRTGFAGPTRALALWGVGRWWSRPLSRPDRAELSVEESEDDQMIYGVCGGDLQRVFSPFVITAAQRGVGIISSVLRCIAQPRSSWRQQTADCCEANPEFRLQGKRRILDRALLAGSAPISRASFLFILSE
jgi:hypothetical protein